MRPCSLGQLNGRLILIDINRNGTLLVRPCNLYAVIWRWPTFALAVPGTGLAVTADKLLRRLIISRRHRTNDSDAARVTPRGPRSPRQGDPAGDRAYEDDPRRSLRRPQLEIRNNVIPSPDLFPHELFPAQTPASKEPAYTQAPEPPAEPVNTQNPKKLRQPKNLPRRPRPTNQQKQTTAPEEPTKAPNIRRTPQNPDTKRTR